MEFINQNTELVITILTMALTWILGFISKRCPYVNNNLIIIQNIVIGLSVSIFYFIITKDFNLAITLSGLFAETGYNLIHNIEKLVKKIVPESRYYLKCPYEMTPTRIVVHNTANDASARNEISYMTNNDYETSFHYAVDDKEIVQGLPENRNGWHASDGNGKGNREGIAIEICYSLSGGDRFIKAEQNAVDLIVDILNRYNWDIDKVTKHQDYTNKYCPHRTLDMGWDRFLNMINEKLSETRARPFIVGTKIYNTEDIYLTETAGYGGGQMLLTKNTESIVKKYHYNKGLYMALGTENTYYDAAWTNNYSKFTTTKPPVEELKEDNKETTKEPEKEDKNRENNNNQDNKDKNNNDLDKELERQNPLLWFIDKIIKLLVKIFKRRKK